MIGNSFFRVLVAGFLVCFCSLILIAGCDGDGMGGGSGSEVPGDMGDIIDVVETGACTNSSSPCVSVSANSDGSIIACELIGTTCGVDLSTVISQVSEQFSVTEDTVMWIQAWGADGGIGSGPASGTGGAGGYAQTTTTIGDLASSSNGSTQIFYFIGQAGGNSGDHCGGTGGPSTIVTFEDLTLSPSDGPDSDEIILVAGGGGGGGGGNGDFGCIPFGGNDGASGGVAIASLGESGEGAGDDAAGGGSGGSQGTGGAGCCGSGGDGFGGMGGNGGSGQDCTSSPNPVQWNNAVGATLDFTAGQGADGGSGTNMCDSGGGGGGGGWGGGGSGSHGNDTQASDAGGGGGSFAIASTQSSGDAPTGQPTNPCGGNGCVQIQFAP